MEITWGVLPFVRWQIVDAVVGIFLVRWKTSRKYSNGSTLRRMYVAVILVRLLAVRPP
jgi:hypothetical protein